MSTATTNAATDDIDQDDSPTLMSVITAAMKGRLDNVRVSIPGRVVAYDKDTQRADVQPLSADRDTNREGEQISTPVPQVNDVPIMFIGAGGYSETFPIEAGDQVLLVFCSSSITRWKSGVQGEDMDPGDDRHHHLADAVAYAGVRDASGKLSDVPNDAWVITVPTGKQIRLGSSTSDASVPRGETVRELIQMIKAAVIAGMNAIAPGGAAGTTAFEAALETSGFDASIATLLSEKVKVD